MNTKRMNEKIATIKTLLDCHHSYDAIQLCLKATFGSGVSNSMIKDIEQNGAVLTVLLSETEIKRISLALNGYSRMKHSKADKAEIGELAERFAKLRGLLE